MCDTVCDDYVYAAKFSGVYAKSLWKCSRDWGDDCMFRRICACVRNWCKVDKNRSIKLGAVAAVLILGIVLLIQDYRIAVSEIEDGIKRNTYGEGTKDLELEVKVEGNVRDEIKVQVSERMYEGEEISEMFRNCIEKIETEILGENESLDHVEKNLNLMTELEDEPVEISWELDNYDVMNIYGEIQEDTTAEEGTMVNLTAVITYTQDQTKQMLYECAAMVYPEKLTKEEEFVRKVQEEIQREDEKTQVQEKLMLPKAVDGKNLQYFVKMDDRGIVLIVMAMIIGVLIYAQEIQNQGQELQKKRQQMLLDYPEIINKLTLFLGAGMTIKRAFIKIVSDYEAGKNTWGIRCAYEEMKIALREMESGITEAESYERFGKRCNIQEYIRLGALLSQNMRKGTKGMTQILRLEAIQAFENRKAAAKKFGEEAGTKLLIPMFLMLAVVLVMVTVPAFLTMQVS